MTLGQKCLMALYWFCLSTVTVSAQIDFGVVVLGDTISTSCTDLFSDPDPQYRITIEGGSVIYPSSGNCYQDPPFFQYGNNYACPADVPANLTICLDVFENDGLFGCNIVESCLVSICQDFPLPTIGDTLVHTISLPAGGDSEGSVEVLFGLQGPLQGDNDLPCNAFSLGTIGFGETLGDASQNIYNNFCATNQNEPQPLDDGGFFNDNGVWFTFNSGPAPSGLFTFRALNNPDGLGDPVNLEMAIYTLSGDPCNGATFSLVQSRFDNSSDDIEFSLFCPEANTDYYILVDGSMIDSQDGLQGNFGLEVSDIGVIEGGDRRCDFVDLGTVPEGGSVMTDTLYANFCADAVQDPFVNGFVSQHSVYFSFVAPASGHVIIEANSIDSINTIGLQLALYRSFSNQCNGFFSQVASQYTNSDFDEVMEVSCLYEGRPYWILVDGDGANSQGVFSITVSDAGDITPVTQQTVVLCAGETLPVGGQLYDTTGMYFDTLTVFAGCDSVVISDLTILDELEVVVEQIMPAIGPGGNEGTAQVSASGGAGGYTFEWCDGQTGSTATGLVGGTQCCVTVTDANGCIRSECLDVIFTTDIVPFFTNDTLACAGDTDGVIRFGPTRGIPPYTYTWTNLSASLNGSGDIMAEGQEIQIPSLPFGEYRITLADDYGDTTFSAFVLEPLPLLITEDMVSDASCFGNCDGAGQPLVSGGTPPYTYQWSTAQTTLLADGLCDGTYTLSVTDANNCMATYDLTISEPPEFIAAIVIDQPISCIGSADGVIRVETNGNPQIYDWNLGANTPSLMNLSADTYSVLVTNDDGCQTMASIDLMEPSEPLLANIAVLENISCQGDADGILVAEVSGPYDTLSYRWSSGQDNVIAGGLGAGMYSLTVTSEQGCTAEASFLLEEPPVLDAALSVRNISCREGESTGAITVSSVSGGQPPYTYAISSDGFFSPIEEFVGLTAGAYEIAVRDAAGCELYLDAMISPAPEFAVNLIAPEEIQLGDSIALEADVLNNDNTIFQWSHDGSLQGEEVFVRPFTTTTYQVVAIDTLTDCRAEASARIFVVGDRRVFVPNAFSPNGDGTNEIFYVFGGDDVARIANFRIFARNGGLLHEKLDIAPNNPDEGWDGTYRGQKMSSGVYVYQVVIDFIDGQTEVYSGDVLLLR